MAQIKVIHDPVGETLTVYWDDPEHEEVCEEVGHGLILIKDAQDEVIGFEDYTLSQKLPSKNSEWYSKRQMPHCSPHK